MTTATDAFLFALPHYEVAFAAWNDLRGTVYEVDAMLNLVAWTWELTRWGGMASQEHGTASGDAWWILFPPNEQPPQTMTAWDII